MQYNYSEDDIFSNILQGLKGESFSIKFERGTFQYEILNTEQFLHVSTRVVLKTKICRTHREQSLLHVITCKIETTYPRYRQKITNKANLVQIYLKDHVK